MSEPLKEPETMEELLYMTRRTLVPKGKARAWVFRKECPRCPGVKMGKPVAKGKIKIRSSEYVCPKCDYMELKQQHEESLMCNIDYECPHCDHKGQTQVPYVRKTFQGVKSIIFHCSACDQKIGVSKKMKDPKKKKPKKKK